MEGEEKFESTSAGKPRGGKLWLIVIIVLIIIAGAGAYLVLAGNSSEGGRGGGILSSVIPSKLNPNCKYNDPDLCKFMNNWKEVEYMTMNSTDTRDGKTYVSTFKMQGENRTQMIMSENGTENFNSITIDKTTYYKDYKDNKWFKYTPKANDEISFKAEDLDINYDDKVEEVEDKTTYQKIGTEACGKLTCFKYKEIDPAQTEYVTFIYFDNKEYQLRKTRTEEKDGSVSEATYDYVKLSIKEPSPIKEGDPYGAYENSAAEAAAAALLQQTGGSVDPEVDKSTDTSSTSDSSSNSLPSSSSSATTTPSDTSTSDSTSLETATPSIVTPTEDTSSATDTSSDDSSSDTTDYDMGE